MEMKVLPLGDYQTNCYLVWEKTGDSCVVIDPGYEPDYVLQQVRNLGKKLEAVLLTHGHFDHVGGVKELAAQTGCPVYLCSEDLLLPPMLTAGELYHTHSYGEGDELFLAGLKFHILETPGHTQGSVCLLCQDAMFSGDTLFAGSCGRTDFPGSDPAKMWQSLSRLKNLPGNYRVYPGHGRETTLDEERRSNPFLQI